MSICDNVCLALEDIFTLTLLHAFSWQDRASSRGVGPHWQSRSAEALPRAYEAGAMLFIALIILFALIVAAVGGGGLILARRLRSLP